MTTPNTTDCQGTWRQQYHPATDNEASPVDVLKCTACGDWMVVIGATGYDVPGSVATNAEQAYIDAVMQATDATGWA